MAKYSISWQGEACRGDAHSPTTVIKLMKLSLHSLVLLECDEGATVHAMKCPPLSIVHLPFLPQSSFRANFVLLLKSNQRIGLSLLVV